MGGEYDSFYLDKEEPAKSCLQALRSIILEQNKYINETRKYGMPCFCYKKKIICYLWTDKKTGEPYILFADGQKLQNPALEAGNRSRMKILSVFSDADIQEQTIKNILSEALALHHD